MPKSKKPSTVEKELPENEMGDKKTSAEVEIEDRSQKARMLGIEEKELIEQVGHEYKLAYDHQKPKKDKYIKRLKLLNNQKRDEEAVGDTTMFSIFFTVLAKLYRDRLMVEFRGTDEGDEETADNLTAMAKNDYDLMGKDVVDYDWDWDTCFFGWGLLLMEEFTRDADANVFCPQPEVIDPITWLRDPAAISPNGNKKGKGAMRFGGREVKMTREAMEEHPSFFGDINFTDLKHGSGTYSLLNDGEQARDDAQGNQNRLKDSEANLGVNAEYTVTEWFTHTKVNGKVKKIKVWLADERKTIVGLKILKRKYWPLVFRRLYAHSHDWDGTSIPDLTEDKQRGRAVAQNLALKLLRKDLYEKYAYDTNKITNKSDLDYDVEFVGIDAKPGEAVGNSIQAIGKARPNMQLLQFIYESIDISAQKATATPDIAMGMQSESDRPLGETNLVASNSDGRQSLSAKVFGWSDKDFWYQYYNMYKDNFDDIDEKILRIVGAFGSKWRKLSKEDITADKDPDIFVESSVVSRAKDLEDRQLLTQFFQIALADPTANRRWGMKKLAKLNGLERDEIDRLFPPTIDERIATDQNDLLNEDKLVPVLPEDDHNVHLEIHAMAKDTNAAKAHIETHKKALSIKKTNPEMFPPDQQGTMMNGPDQGGGNIPVLPANSGARPVTPSMTSNQR